MPRWRVPFAVSIVAGVALLVGACGSDERRICERSGATEVCLVGGPSSYHFEGEGFKANSEATLTSVRSGGQPAPIPIDASGRVAKDGITKEGTVKLEVLGGPDPQEFVVAGTTLDGKPVEFKLTVPPI